MSDATHLKRAGYNALLADHCELADAVAAQAAVLEDLRERKNYISALSADLLHELEALRARVAKLEAQHATQDAMPITGPPSDSAFTIRTDGSLERNASTATAVQTYTWLPGEMRVTGFAEEQP